MVELSDNIVECLSVDMSFKMDHFYTKFNSLSEKEQAIASKHLNLLFQCANDLKYKSEKHVEFDRLYYESNNSSSVFFKGVVA